MATSPTSPRQILHLDSLANRPVVVIDGKEYEILMQQMLPPLDSHRVVRIYARGEALMEAALTRDLSAEEEAELAAIPDRICRLVLVAPEEVHAALEDRQRMAIVAAFNQVLPMEPSTESTTAPTASPSTGEK